MTKIYILIIILLGIILTILGFVLGLSVGNSPETAKLPEDDTLDDLLDAIEQIESSGDPDAVGDNGAAVGSYQIHKIYVDDVNRILKGWKRQVNEQIESAEHRGIGGWFVPYSYEDRRNRNYSRDMAEVYLTYYTPLDDDYNIDLEKAARIHNGGPDGWKKKATEKYWLKVKSAMEAKL